ncbi:hypothetical protein Hanom_Chr07g00608741 [Helianthus anomalus]
MISNPNINQQQSVSEFDYVPRLSAQIKPLSSKSNSNSTFSTSTPNIHLKIIKQTLHRCRTIRLHNTYIMSMQTHTRILNR